VTAFLPTLITSPFEEFVRCARAILDADHPSIAGFHMEGPYINPADGLRGAHRREFAVGADWDDVQRRRDAAEGRIRLVTLAPEVPGALALIERLVLDGVRVAVGHTAASPEQIRDAVRAGATLSTHLGNGCGVMLSRHPNFLWEQLAADELTASFIVDGIHLSPSTVKVMIRAKTPERTVLVTDAIAAAGCPPGRYRLGGVEAELDASGRVIELAGGRLAGSSLTLPAAVANTVRFAGVSIGDAVTMASTRPAAAVGLTPRGRITADWDPETFTFTIRSTNPEAPA
jgi:N-acetylglucosamine-6-phosphate deacetylase